MPNSQTLKPQWLNTIEILTYTAVQCCVQGTVFHMVILGPRPLPCCGSKVTAERKRDYGVLCKEMFMGQAWR